MEFLCQELSKINNQSININNLISICNSYYLKPAHNISDLKLRNQKIKGDIFEAFCYLYLINIYKLDKVWYISQLPKEIQHTLNLTTNDMGIDLIGQDSQENFYAIQAKFKKRNGNRKTMVSWKQLSTFYALCLKTGPYKKHIIITTADYVRHVGNKTQKDETIGYNKLSKINHFDWLILSKYFESNKGFYTINDQNKIDNLDQNKIDNLNQNKIDNLDQNKIDKPDENKQNNNISLKQLREKRLFYFEKL